jgi:hypothetical protein
MFERAGSNAGTFVSFDVQPCVRWTLEPHAVSVTHGDSETRVSLGADLDTALADLTIALGQPTEIANAECPELFRYGFGLDAGMVIEAFNGKITSFSGGATPEGIGAYSHAGEVHDAYGIDLGFDTNFDEAWANSPYGAHGATWSSGIRLTRIWNGAPVHFSDEDSRCSPA